MVRSQNIKASHITEDMIIWLNNEWTLVSSVTDNSLGMAVIRYNNDTASSSFDADVIFKKYT